MKAEEKPIRFDDIPLKKFGNGFSGNDLIELGGFELSFLKGDPGSGHDFHKHDDQDEILIWLEGECIFNLGDEEMDIKGPAALHIPHGVDHKVNYKSSAKVLRIRLSNPG